ncbi:MAG: energy-coupling factor transporter transmembrane protein EcfT [Clostridia bacterium]|nr:energy-coupling factor transporter transmembrane protein EcfT [Clostridia bacterium]
MREITLGQYYPVKSIIHSLDARVKIILMVAYIVMVFFAQSFFSYGVIGLFLLFTIFLSRIPLLKILKSLKSIAFLIIFTVIMSVLFYAGKESDILWSWGIIKIYNQGLINAAKMTLRLILIVLGPMIITFTTTAVALTNGIESVLKPLKFIGVPVHTLAMVMSIALRMIPSLVEETDKIQSAQKARCADFESGNLIKRAKAMIPVLIPLFVSSFRRADELADAMDSRCYRGAKGRTKMKKSRFGLRDAIALIVFAVTFFVILWLNFNFFPTLIDLKTIAWMVV